MTTPTIRITGGLGFIGSNLVRHLNSFNITPVIYDRMDGEKWRNVAGLSFELRDWKKAINGNYFPADEVLIHLGADVDTTESFSRDLWENNVEFSLKLFQHYQRCRIVYASSAAVYGSEETDFSERLYGLKPLNAYAFTKHALDQAVFGAAQRARCDRIYGLRFFNVYGPNEGHKGAMASVVRKALAGNLGTSQWELFKSHRSGVADGDQQRDFVHVEDVCRVIAHFALANPAPERGLYNVGTGTARTFNELVRAIDPTRDIVYRDMPANLRDQYQYRTCADLARLRAAGYTAPLMALEEGVKRMTT